MSMDKAWKMPKLCRGIKPILPERCWKWSSRKMHWRNARYRESQLTELKIAVTIQTFKNVDPLFIPEQRLPWWVRISFSSHQHIIGSRLRQQGQNYRVISFCNVKVSKKKTVVRCFFFTFVTRHKEIWAVIDILMESLSYFRTSRITPELLAL